MLTLNDCASIIGISEGSPPEVSGAVLAPWEARLYQPVSWLEMLQFSAQMFFWCGSALRSIKAQCMLAATSPSGTHQIVYTSRPIDDELRTDTLSALKRIESQFRTVGLGITADTVVHLMRGVEKPSPFNNLIWLMDQVEAIEQLAQRELKGKIFFYIPPERAKFFPRQTAQHIFGDEVAAAFPNASFDVSEAGMCLALARGTSGVFHLMRVLEIGLTALGNKFGVSLEHTNWAPAIGEIESKIRGMPQDPQWKTAPDCKAQQEFYSQAASHFGILKDAWRNYTAHVRGIYTEEQAELIFDNVKAFMQKLAQRLHE